MLAFEKEMVMHIRKITIRAYEAVYALWLSCAGMGLNDLGDSLIGIPF